MSDIPFRNKAKDAFFEPLRSQKSEEKSKRRDRVKKRNPYARELGENGLYKPKVIQDKRRKDGTKWIRDVDLDEEDYT
jgi:hypothetical protein